MVTEQILTTRARCRACDWLRDETESSTLSINLVKSLAWEHSRQSGADDPGKCHIVDVYVKSSLVYHQ